MLNYFDSAISEERRKDMLKQAEIDRQVAKVFPAPKYGALLLKEARESFSHAVRFFKVLVAAFRSLLLTSHTIAGHR